MNFSSLSFPRRRESSLSAVWRDMIFFKMDSRLRGNDKKG
jgi:hypothetical protein